VTYYTVFGIELQSRRVHVAGSTPFPDEAFVLQGMRSLANAIDGVLANSRTLRGHLRLLAREYVEHDHRERNHQGLDNRLLQHAPPPKHGATHVQRRDRLGGLLNFSSREAA
jgi:hypothetical protein